MGATQRGMPLPFDVEGVGRQRLDFAREGVLGRPAQDSQTAAREGLASTGHAAAPESGAGAPAQCQSTCSWGPATAALG